MELEAVMTVTTHLEVAETSIILMVIKCKLCKRERVFSFFLLLVVILVTSEKCLNLLLDFGSETGNVHHGVPANRRENGARNHWAGSSVSSGVLGRQPPSNRFLTSCGLLVSDFVKNVHYFVLS